MQRHMRGRGISPSWKGKTSSGRGVRGPCNGDGGLRSPPSWSSVFPPRGAEARRRALGRRRSRQHRPAVQHEPITPESSRVQLVEALKPVDRAVLGHEGNIYDILDEIRPDVIALGFDQVHDEQRILEESRKRGLATKVVRLPKFEGDLDGTRKIVRKVAEWLALQERLSEVERAPPEPAVPAARRKRKA